MKGMRIGYGVIKILHNAMFEAGLLEMEWAFEAGDKGHVAVDGYGKKIYFEISSEGYRTDVGL